MKQKSMKRSVLVVAMAKYTTIITGVLFSAIMARLLTPTDYGIFAVVSIFLNFFMTASDLGIGAAVIQKMDLTESNLNHIFTFTGLVGIILGAMLVVLGIPISMFYKDNVYFILCIWLSISVFFYAINIVPNAVMLRNGMFNQIAIRNVAVNITALVVAMFMAFVGCKYYSLVGQSLVTFITYFVWNQYTARLKPLFKLTEIRDTIKKIASYSIFQFASDSFYYLELNTDNLIVSTVLGSTPLAYYDKAYRLLDYPVGNLAGTLNTILHPILKDYQSDPDIMREKFLYIEKIFSLISVFIVSVCFVCSREIVGILYGAQWEASVLTFQIMSLAIYPKMLLSIMNTIFTSLGDTKLLFRTQIKKLVIVTVCVLIGVFFGNIETVAVAIVVSSWINLLLVFTTLMRQGFKTRGYIFFTNYGVDITVMAIISLTMFIISRLFFFNNIFISAIIKGSTILIIYTIYLLVSGNIGAIINLLPVRLRDKLTKKNK